MGSFSLSLSRPETNFSESEAIFKLIKISGANPPSRKQKQSLRVSTKIREESRGNEQANWLHFHNHFSIYRDHIAYYKCIAALLIHITRMKRKSAVLCFHCQMNIRHLILVCLNIWFIEDKTKSDLLKAFLRTRFF